VTLNLAETSVIKSRPSVPHRANLFNYSFYLLPLSFAPVVEYDAGTLSIFIHS